ncbi:hypothetical protein J5N97_014525 [Dioscorea zingiberensis]|uniref:Uncharacterized protein n=1 Tax=Dioscorea zingiberensis TaxID=325984 RepID=A0A9D5HJT0_9LILI|nr:hypothetical protein J5N97_014525 [Dioscorea zingiberensis]
MFRDSLFKFVMPTSFEISCCTLDLCLYPLKNTLFSDIKWQDLESYHALHTIQRIPYKANQAYDQHLNMILGDVEEIITTVEIDDETYEEIVRRRLGEQYLFFCERRWRDIGFSAVEDSVIISVG